MAKPQSPELRRSGKASRLDPDGIAGDLAAAPPPGTTGDAGPVPDGNRPGHRPADEQDKPDLDAFAAKLGTDRRPAEAPEPDPDPAPDPAPPPEVRVVPEPSPLAATLGEVVARGLRVWAGALHGTAGAIHGAATVVDGAAALTTRLAHAVPRLPGARRAA